MGLDAKVYCDCLENGGLRNPLPDGVTVKIEPDGRSIAVRHGEEIWEDHPDWSDFACIHECHRLIHHRLGNVGVIGLLRNELSRDPAAFPILLQKVVYNGMHAGDYLSLEQIPALQSELERLKTFKCAGNMPTAWLPRFMWTRFRFGRYHYTSASRADEFMQNFRAQMAELADAALKVRKPIAF